MHRRQLFGLVIAALVSGRRAFAEAPLVEVMKDPTCGCCMNWVVHVEKAGFKTKVTESTDMNVFKDAKRVPKMLRSCHTGLVGGYVLEGHVPAADIKRLLAERPKVSGLAVPGMPLGAPGMEVATGQTQPYDVVAFDAAGNTHVFAAHGRKA